MILGPQEPNFNDTFVHETGHVVLRILNGFKSVAIEPMAAIPHTTAALTDRGTAFNEGFAIHLETLAAHVRTDQPTRNRYRHERIIFGQRSQTHQ